LIIGAGLIGRNLIVLYVIIQVELIFFTIVFLVRVIITINDFALIFFCSTGFFQRRILYY